MERKDIRIHRLQCATIISSTERFISYDHRAGNEDKPMQCIASFCPPEKFMNDLTGSKIITTGEIFGAAKRWEVFSFMLSPRFGYTNQKLEDIMCELFEKYNL